MPDNEVSGVSLFRVSDIKWLEFLSQLVNDKSVDQPCPGKRIWMLLTRSIQKLIENSVRDNNIQDENKSKIIIALNKILNQRNFYKVQDFTGFELSYEVKNLLRRKRKELSVSDIQRLNRLLLETAYPLGIVKSQLSSSLEDYLETIYHIVQQKQAARAKDIADQMAVNSSSVTGALQSLAAKGLVNYAPYDIITLTVDGNRVAMDVIRRHEALQCFLEKVLSVESKEAEEAACKMEHDISPKILERLVQFLDFVDNCPIGGARWSESKGFICKHKEVFGDCEKCKEEFDKQRSTTDVE